MSKSPTDSGDIHHVKSDLPFYVLFGLISGFYVVMILAMLIAESTFTTADEFFSFLGREEVQFSIRLSLLSCAMSTILSLWVAVPIGYLMSRYHFRGKSIIDAVLDIPIVLPPLVIGLCLLILFSTPVALSIESTLLWIARSIGNNLVPLSVLALMSVVAAIFYFVLRHRIKRRMVGLLVPIAMQTLHGFTFGATHLGAIYFIARRMPQALSASAQSLYSAIVMGLALGAASLTAGKLYALYGSGAYQAMALLAAAGGGAALMLMKRR